MRGHVENSDRTAGCGFRADDCSVTGVSLDDLLAEGRPAVAAHLDRDRPPATALEWLGIGLTRLPSLAEQARTVDGMSPHPRRISAAGALERMLDSFHAEIAEATAIVHEALKAHLVRHPSGGDEHPAPAAEAHARLLIERQGSSPRLAEFLIAGHLTFIGAAVEASGTLTAAELAVASLGPGGSAGARQAKQRAVELRAEQVESALVAALGGLLAYSELAAERRAAVRG